MIRLQIELDIDPDDKVSSVSLQASALGITGSTASGIQVFLEEGAWTKRFHPGWGATACTSQWATGAPKVSNSSRRRRQPCEAASQFSRLDLRYSSGSALIAALSSESLSAQDKIEKRAFLVGVAKYSKDGLPDLSYSENDMKVLSC